MLDFDRASDLDVLLFRQADVLAAGQARRFFTKAAIRHRLASNRWQRPHRGVIVTRSGPLSREQRRWVALLSCGQAAMLGGLSALEVLGLSGFARPAVHVLLPASRRADRPPPFVVVHRSRLLPHGDMRLRAMPPSTMPARSVVDAASWATHDDDARAIVAASFQQRLVAGNEVAEVVSRLGRIRRAGLILRTAKDAAGGAHSLGELDFLAVSRRAGLPEATLQRVRLDASGRRRYLDVLYEEYGVHVEIDGAQHMDVRRAWEDMKRQNDTWISGARVLRFPAWLVRERPDEVIAQVRAALLAAGWPG